MSRRPLSASRAYVYGSMFNTAPPDEEDDPDDEGGIDTLERDGFDLSCDDAPEADEHAAGVAADAYQRGLDRTASQ